eukprot:3716868-Prymnesium_polylepis.1
MSTCRVCHARGRGPAVTHGCMYHGTAPRVAATRWALHVCTAPCNRFRIRSDVSWPTVERAFVISV